MMNKEDKWELKQASKSAGDQATWIFPQFFAGLFYDLIGWKSGNNFFDQSQREFWVLGIAKALPNYSSK